MSALFKTNRTSSKHNANAKSLYTITNTHSGIAAGFFGISARAPCTGVAIFSTDRKQRVLVLDGTLI